MIDNREMEPIHARGTHGLFHSGYAKSCEFVILNQTDNARSAPSPDRGQVLIEIPAILSGIGAILMPARAEPRPMVPLRNGISSILYGVPSA